MTQFVLDNSVAMRWLQPTDKTEDQRKAQAILRALQEFSVCVPALWWYEVANVLAGLRKRGAITAVQVEQFMSWMNAFDIATDQVSREVVWGQVHALAVQYNLSAYDATYLELAKRKQLPLATLDKDLRKAAQKAGVKLFK